MVHENEITAIKNAYISHFRPQKYVKYTSEDNNHALAETINNFDVNEWKSWKKFLTGFSCYWYSLLKVIIG